MNGISNLSPPNRETIRVVFTWGYMFYEVDGVQRVLLQCLDELPKYGIDPYVVTLKGSGERRDLLLSKYPGRIIECKSAWPGPKWKTATGADETSPIRRAYRSVVDKPMLRYRWAQFHYDVLGTIAALRPDVVALNYSWHFDLSLLLHEFSGTVGFWHSGATSEVTHRPFQRYGSTLDAVVASSPAGAQNLVDAGEPHYRDKVRAITYGIDPISDSVPDRIGSADRPLRVAYVGRFLERDKRISDVPKIVRALAERGIPVEVSLVGEGPDYEQTCDEVKATGVTVRCPGTVLPEDVRNVFLEHDVMILTSDSEGGPLALLEAMATGCVPVVSRCPSGLIPLVIKNGVNGLTFEIGDIAGAVDQLAKLSADRALLGQLSAIAVETSKEYPLDETHRQYADLFWGLSRLSKRKWSKSNYFLSRAKHLRVLSRTI
jgi:glycosyltransferase involved in cell wall biosynthesis